jgi:hypothetical protein
MRESNSARTNSSSWHTRSTNWSSTVPVVLIRHPPLAIGRPAAVPPTPGSGPRTAACGPHGDDQTLMAFCRLSTADATAIFRGFACSATGIFTSSTPSV